MGYLNQNGGVDDSSAMSSIALGGGYVFTPASGTTQVSKDLAAAYAIASAVSKDLAAAFSVISAVSKDLAASYSVTNTLTASKDLAASYNVITAVSTDLAAAYQIKVTVSKDLTVTYSVLGSTSITSDILINNTGTPYTTETVYWTFHAAGRVGALTGITPTEGSKALVGGQLTLAGLPAGAGRLCVAVRGATPADDLEFVQHFVVS